MQYYSKIHYIFQLFQGCGPCNVNTVPLFLRIIRFVCTIHTIQNIFLLFSTILSIFLHLKCQFIFLNFPKSYQLYNILTKQLFFLLTCINIKITHFFVDKVYNSVYNLFFCHFWAYFVDNFSTLLSTGIWETIIFFLSNRVVLCKLYNCVISYTILHRIGTGFSLFRDGVFAEILRPKTEKCTSQNKKYPVPKQEIPRPKTGNTPSQNKNRSVSCGCMVDSINLLCNI